MISTNRSRGFLARLVMGVTLGQTPEQFADQEMARMLHERHECGPNCPHCTGLHRDMGWSRLGAACHSLDIDTDRENDPAVDDAIHGLSDEDGEATSGGAVLVGVLALLFALAVVALFRHWHVDIGWLFRQFGR
jgi:hypothetical protein